LRACLDLQKGAASWIQTAIRKRIAVTALGATLKYTVFSCTTWPVISMSNGRCFQPSYLKKIKIRQRCGRQSYWATSSKNLRTRTQDFQQHVELGIVEPVGDE
jgi:hypothetical protein